MTIEQEIAARFLLGERRYDHREFLMELGRVGLKFIRDKVDPDDQKRFAEAFDGLVGLGCRPETLAGTLYCFCKSYVGLELSSPPHGMSISFPSKQDIKKYRDALEAAARIIGRLDEYGIMAVLAKHAECGDTPNGRDNVVNVLHWYANLLPTWWAPRKDIVRSYAPIACCMYPKIATGQYQFPLVAILLECFGYKPDPKRQQKSGHRPEGYDSSDQSLERNFRNFKKAYPTFCEQLEFDLVDDHDLEERQREEAFDHWVGEHDLPIEVFDKLRPNPFDWKAVFPYPNRKSRKPKRR